MINEDTLKAVDIVGDMIAKDVDTFRSVVDEETGDVFLQVTVGFKGVSMRFNANQLDGVPKPDERDKEYQRFLKYLEGILYGGQK